MFTIITIAMDILNELLGLHEEKLNAMQMCFRALIVFFAALIFIRIAGLRTFGRTSSFDKTTALILGAVLGRSIVSNQSFFGSLAACLLIMLLHRLIAWVGFTSKTAGKIFKGEPLLLYKDGKYVRSNMRRTHITEDDITEAIHLLPNLDKMSEVKEAYLERSGEISIIKAEQ
jgi:uncharacterized membrane protein YcaP (DUF421 family)